MRRAILIFVCLYSLTSHGQVVHWADEVVGFSSQKSDLLFSASQALGKPNKFPDFSFTPCAWMPDLLDRADSTFIHLGFKEPQTVGSVVLVQSFHPEIPVSVYLKQPDGKEIYIPVPANLRSDNIMQIPVLPARPGISTIRIVWNGSMQGDPFQLDALGVMTEPGRVPIPFYTDTLGQINKPEALENLNSPYDEVLPVVSPDGRMLYFDRKKHPLNTGPDLHDDIWYARLMADSSWSAPLNIGPPLNDEGHNFINAVSADGNTLLLGNTYNRTETQSHWMSFSYKTSNGWSTPVPINIIGFQNRDQYNEFSMSADGQYIVLSIESNTTNGMRDIYVSRRISDRYYSAPKNLGPVVNSAATEMSPFLAADGQTLYFASNGWPGYGGYDIYMTRRLDETWEHWTEPLNLGSGINTANWEAYFTTDAMGNMAYFCSSKGGDNLNLYRVPLSPVAQPADLVQFTGKVLNRSSGNMIDATISYVLLSDSVSEEGSTTSLGGNAFNAYLRPDSKYLITINADGYFSEVTEWNSAQADGEQLFYLIPRKVGTAVTLENIYFKVNTSVLVDSSFTELEKTARFLLDHPDVHIEVRGHTNGLCDDSYCLSLSQRRARSVVDFFIDSGIDEDRLSFAGMGKTEPIADNDTPEGRQRNQRVEFIITKVE